MEDLETLVQNIPPHHPKIGTSLCRGLVCGDYHCIRQGYRLVEMVNTHQTPWLRIVIQMCIFIIQRNRSNYYIIEILNQCHA